MKIHIPTTLRASLKKQLPQSLYIWSLFSASFTYAKPLTLDSYLELVLKNNSKVQAGELQKKAAKLKSHQVDYLELSPMLIAGAAYSKDTQETNMPAQQGTSTLAKLYTLGLSKNFSTGTNITAKWGQTFTDIDGTLGFTIEPRWESAYKLEVSQSLWKNSFGHATRLRHQRESSQTKLALLKAESEIRGALIEAENAYWDFVMQTLDVSEKAETLKRVQKTRDWTAKRLQNGIADRADLLQVDSLLTKTKLAQLDSKNKLEVAKKSFLDALGVAKDHTIQPATDTLGKSKSLFNRTDNPKHVEVWAKDLIAKTGSIGSQEAIDMTKPDLSLTGAFGANDRDASLGSSASNAIATDNTVYLVGLKFGMSLDFGLKSDLNAAARAEALAAKILAEKAALDESNSWNELSRKHAELSATIELMEDLVKTLSAKLKREQERLEIGRTITANVVNFEQELADASLLLLQTKVAQRRIESLARLYLSQNEVEAL